MAETVPDAHIRLSLQEAQALCESAALRRGASVELARSIAAAAVRAEGEAQPAVGLAHYLDYLSALEAGRIDGGAEPMISRPAPAIILSDANRGAAHTGFDRAFPDLVATARSFGLGLFVQKNAFTSGALGYFAVRLAEERLLAIAATNGPALLAGAGSTRPVYCTNPLALAAPVEGAAPLLIDQSSSATAYVNIARAARQGQAIPEGWALDAEGRPTTDAKAAISGALLAFGGERGANIALMVEVLAAGVSGANWSLDAPSFNAGSESPSCGLFVLALDAALVDPGFASRMGAQMSRLSGTHGVHIPGRSKASAWEKAQRDGIVVSQELIDRLAAPRMVGQTG